MKGYTMANQPAALTRDILEMSVSDMAFLIDRLGEDCSPLQFLRELTKNSIEGVHHLGGPAGEVRWDLDWNRFDLTGESVSKLCVIDTGVGMTGEEMVHYINKLSSSIHKQSKTGNFGVGAKIAAAPLNPEGLIYLSWKDGRGHMIHLFRDPKAGIYGLKRFPNGEFWQHISDDLKPEPIKDHGTMVVLLGRSPEENTMAAPPRTPMPRKWILRYLNSRFFRFPKNVVVKAREGWELPRGDKHNFLRTVTGMGPWLDENSESRGITRLSTTRATAHWWIIKKEADTNSGHYTPGGHVAASFQDELYELAFGNAGFARLQAFGVVFGCDRVVVYVEPDNDTTQQVNANTARTNLLINGEVIDWPGYATEFRALMPQELRDFQDQIGLGTQSNDHRKAISERLKTIKELFRFGRFRPSKSGKYKLGEPTPNSGGDRGRADRSEATGTADGGGRGGSQGDIYSLFAEQVGEPAEAVSGPIEPEIVWISEENGKRAQGDLEDRAARYLADQNKILVNGDFRVFTDMVERWERKYQHVGSAHAVIVDVVREWFSQQLIETVMSAWALKQGGKWSMQELPQLWDEEALTAAVLPRYHIDANVKRVLGQRLGTLRPAA